MQKIAVSIIVPAYNAETTIKECLDSILKQTLKEIEIIVVNDGSVDKTQEILTEYAQTYKDKVIVINKKNEGVSIARNTGMAIARGEYIGFVDADDTVVSNMFSLMYEKAMSTNSDLVQCWRYNVLPEGEKIIEKGKCVGESIYENPAIISDQTLFVWDKIFRRTIIDKHNIHFKGFRYAEDFAFLFEFEVYATGIELVEKPLYKYVVRREGAATASYNEILLDIPKAFKYINDLAIEKGIFLEVQRYLWYVESAYYVRRLNDFYLYDNKEVKESLAKAFFELFDEYFYGWRETIKWRDAKKKIEVRANAYRSDWDKMQKHIHRSMILNRLSRKRVHVVVRSLNLGEKAKKKVLYVIGKNGIRKKIKKRDASIKYAKYRNQPIKENAVLLTSYYGSSFSDSMYYMAKDLLERENIKVYIGSNNLNRDMIFTKFNNIKVELVNTSSDFYYELLATAKYLVCNSRFPAYFSKRQEQVYINTWHGTPLKTLGKDMRSGLRDVGNNQSNFLMCDYLLYPNEFCYKSMIKSFYLDELYTGKVLCTGYPRNSVFLEKQKEQEIKKALGIEGKKVYVYMPTWRGKTLNTADILEYEQELTDILDELDASLNDDTIIFIKLHQVVMRKIKIKDYKHIKKTHPMYENYEFLSMADGLITDYSSVFFDFANTKKDIVLFTYDYEQYMQDRGTYFDIKELPFTRVDNASDLVEYLNKDKFEVSEEYKKFVEEFCNYDRADSPKLVNDVLLHEKYDPSINVIDYASNKEKEYTIHFMSNLQTEEQQEEFKALVDSVDKNSIFVFAQWSFKVETDEMLSSYSTKDMRYIVTQSEMPITLSEMFAIKLFRRTGLLKEHVRKIYLREVDRILPNIKIGKIINHSNDPKYNDITRLLENKK